MSRNSFFFVLAHLAFDGEKIRAEPTETRSFCCCEETAWIVQWTVLEILKGMWLPVHWWNPIPYAQSNFIQTVQSKQASKIWIAVQVNQRCEIRYTFVTAPCTGKPQNKGAQFYHSGTENVTKYLIERMDVKQKLEGRNISFDRLYTSFTLAKWLLNEKHVTCIGKLMTNRKGIPSDVNEIQHREVQSTEFYWDKEHDLILGSYVVNSSTKKKKNLLLFSAHKPILGTTMDDDKDKAAPYKLHEFIKGGTDIVDQRMGFYTCKFKSRKWSMVAFSYIVDMGCVNSSTLFAVNGIEDPLKQSSFEFGIDIVCSLVGPFIQQRN